MIYLARKNGRVIIHADKQAMFDLDGVTPEMEITDEQFEAAEGIVRIINGNFFFGKTDKEIELENLAAEEQQLKKELDSKDYKVTQAAERGQVLAEIDTELHERREWCRNRINEIRVALKEDL